ncbi:MAG TPA: cupin domain-containing protein [Thermoanaerobaculia bacterium]|nr:cupin domain-containing protein [Thermoanaerobaculia bacterium]
MKKLMLLGTAVVLAAASGLSAADETPMKPKKPMAHKAAPAAKMAMAVPDDMKWGDVPPLFSPGAKLAVLEGNPFGTGYYTVALKMPDGYKVMPHWHPATERVTVISGDFHAGMGDKMDEAGAKDFPPGSFISIPPHMHHFAFAKGETVVQVSGPAPFKLVYVNPADDPSGMQGKKPAAQKAAEKTGE